jgi:hypothetical protein
VSGKGGGTWPAKCVDDLRRALCRVARRSAFPANGRRDVIAKMGQKSVESTVRNVQGAVDELRTGKFKNVAE